MLRGLATSRVPWGNMYEFINLTASRGLVAGAVVLRRPQYRALWVFVLVPVLILLTVSRQVAVRGRRAGDARAAVLLAADPRLGGQPRLRGVPGRRRRQHPVPAQDVAARRAGPADGALARIVARLPDAQTLDRIAYRTTIFAFPVFGFGVIFGAIWAEEAWGRYWGWDPKETVSFIAWVVYAAYLHARSTAGWRDRKAAWINVVGFVAMVFNLFFINLVTVGLHSYAGVG